jgi:GNAT superfamily N-acetyltransferase
MNEPYVPSALRSLQLYDPLAGDCLGKHGFERYTADDLELLLINQPCWDRVQAGPEKRIYEQVPGFSAAELRKYFDDAIAGDSDVELNTAPLDQSPGLYEGGRVARYRPVIFTAKNLKEPAGFAALTIHLPSLDELDESEDELLVVVDCELIYVIPAHRGMGFGITLAQYLSTAISKQLEGIARRWAGGPVNLAATLLGDWESEEGEQVFRTVFEDVQYWVESYGDEIYKLTGVRIELPEEDAGY